MTLLSSESMRTLKAILYYLTHCAGNKTGIQIIKEQRSK